MPLYHEGNRSFQDRFDARRLADRIEPGWKRREWARDVLSAGDPVQEG